MGERRQYENSVYNLQNKVYKTNYNYYIKMFLLLYISMISREQLDVCTKDLMKPHTLMYSLCIIYIFLKIKSMQSRTQGGHNNAQTGTSTFDVRICCFCSVFMELKMWYFGVFHTQQDILRRRLVLWEAVMPDNCVLAPIWKFWTRRIFHYSL